MKKRICIIIAVLLVLFLAFAIGFRIKSEVRKYSEAKQATIAIATEQLGEGCKLIASGLYKGPAPYGRGFWYGFIDETEVKTVMFTAVPTLAGNRWFVSEHGSQIGGNPYEFFRAFSR